MSLFLKNNLTLPIILSLTLGLMPYFPQPHILGKLKWVIGGGNGMTFIDWADLLWHSFPFVWLIFVIIFKIKNLQK
ncbi:MAG: hypothetical protein IPP08_11275 [Chlorobiota bacterium]|jgi:hypothetical protein|nr:hypothetical protein [Chlorobiota bacterium]QQS66327.1 MAG: hypothetical protein IPP08_11275 [Chlorobiota bacterium]